ncbi:MAG: helix-hairpin-helix domain-containing protein [Lachnospiraceae bacterium]|nr:helix-hairpin-helix domain-containing protein [Lachnospiraceae bacterium]MDE6252358.1 helix-hairpin-helix domain-containing protein [Lachnospiraceae bacterium]
MKLHDWLKWAAVISAVCIFGVMYITRDNGMEEQYIQELSSEEMSGQPESILTSAFLYVEVCGCVNTPGVYEVPEGTRVYQVIEMAGGLKEEAGPGTVNQAEAVTDGQQIYIPSKDEEILQYESMANGLININKASMEELMSLPGIGQSKAEAIISYRDSVGRFITIEDIMNVSGIKDAAFNKIKELICV